MALYLQMDGVDDKLVAATILYDKIVIDMYNEYVSGTPYYFSSRNTAGGSYASSTGATADFVSAGVTRTLNGVTTTNYFPRNERILAGFEMTTAVTHGVYILARDNNTSYRKGNIYDVKIYYQGVLKAHYDMTTGTVQDQSGNGNHATLTGGTWLDDGVGGGTDGSTAFDIRPSIYSDSFATSDTKQSLYADSSFNADTKQAIYSDSASGQDTKLSFYQDGSTLYDTLQELFSDGIVGSTPFDLRLVLYEDSFVNSDMALRTYMDGTVDFDALQSLLEEWAEYNEVIRVVLNISRKQNETIDVTQRMTDTLDITQRKQSELKL